MNLDEYVGQVYSKLFGSFDMKTLNEFMREKAPYFGPTPGKLEDMIGRLGEIEVQEIKKEIGEIEENINSNLDVVVDALEEVNKNYLSSKKDIQDRFTDIVKINADKKLIMISQDKYTELMNASSTVKSSNKMLSDMSKKIIKENTSYVKEVKLLKDKLDESTKELTSVRERESRDSLPRNTSI